MPKYSDKACPTATSAITYPQWTADRNIPTYAVRGRKVIGLNRGISQLNLVLGTF